MSRPAIVSVRFMSTPNPAPAAGTPTTPPSSTPTPAENPATNAANAATNLGSLTGSPPASNTDKAADHRAEGSPKPPSPSNIPKLYVGNLNWRATNEDLAQAFSQFGTVREAIVIMDRENPTRSRGFGFVTMSTMEEAEKAVKAMDQKTWLGRPVRVNLANLNTRPRPPQ